MSCGKSQCMMNEMKQIPIFYKHFYLIVFIQQAFQAQECKIVIMQKTLSKKHVKLKKINWETAWTMILLKKDIKPRNAYFVKLTGKKLCLSLF